MAAAEMRDLERWRLSDWKEVLAVAFFLGVTGFGACTLLDKAGKTLDENREGIKSTVAKVGEVAHSIGEITSALEGITKKVGGNVDAVIDTVKDRLAAIKNVFDLKIAGLQGTVDGKPDDRTIWERILGALFVGGGAIGARNVASGRKKKRHMERLYDAVGKLKDDVLVIKNSGAPAAAGG